eukprot:GHVU01189636.1.p1 GENE.GHVU01189636.1~~GHVU01189636.1.p1  ORF type:complete len:304 (-),score=47.96 GHVU01189636.1:165-1001(-)
MTAAGFGYSYCHEKNISASDIQRSVRRYTERCSIWGTDHWNKMLTRIAPVSREPLLPEKKDLNYPEHVPTLVIDLDKVVVKMEHDRSLGWRVRKRPGADKFFSELLYYYEIVVWSDDPYPVAEEVCSKWGVPVVGALHRDQCVKVGETYVKDLSRLGRKLEKVVIVDHDPSAFSLQPENGILLAEFDGGDGDDEQDNELEKLAQFLKMAAQSEDVRDPIRDFSGYDGRLTERFTGYRQTQMQRAESRRSLLRSVGVTRGSLKGLGVKVEGVRGGVDDH